MAQRIDALIPTVLKQTATRHEALFLIQRKWRGLVGAGLAAHSKPVGLRQGRLIIHADRPGDAFALSYRRPQLLIALRDMTKGRVEDILVRPGEAR